MWITTVQTVVLLTVDRMISTVCLLLRCLTPARAAGKAMVDGKGDTSALEPIDSTSAVVPLRVTSVTNNEDKQRAAGEDADAWEGTGPPAAALYDSEEERLAGLLPDTNEAALMEKRKKKAQKLIAKKMEYTLNPRKVQRTRL